MSSILLISPSDGGVGDHAAGTARELERRGFAVRRILVARAPGGAWRGVARCAREWRTLREVTRVHVELGRLDAELFWFALAASFRRRDIVVVAHDVPPICHAPAAALVGWEGVWADRLAYRVLGRLLDGPLRRVFARRMRHAVVLGNSAAAAWEAFGGRSVSRVRQGADTPVTAGVPPSQGRFVLFAGFIGPVKGLDLLLEAWPRASAGSSMELVVAGGNGGSGKSSYADELRQRASRLERVRWLGAVDEEEFAQLFADAAVVCLPYRASNPASAILVRAIVHGRAILATRVAAVTGALQEGDALVVPPDDAGALATALARLIDEPELRDRLGAAAARRAGSTFAWRYTVDDLLDAYRAASAPSVPGS